jgi:hypothetical protein
MVEIKARNVLAIRRRNSAPSTTWRSRNPKAWKDSFFITPLLRLGICNSIGGYVVCHFHETLPISGQKAASDDD